MRPWMSVQQHDRWPFAAAADAERRLSDIDELDLKPVEEAHPGGLPEILSLRTHDHDSRPARIGIIPEYRCR
jgi:hypothetical protein